MGWVGSRTAPSTLGALPHGNVEAGARAHNTDLAWGDHSQQQACRFIHARIGWRFRWKSQGAAHALCHKTSFSVCHDALDPQHGAIAGYIRAACACRNTWWVVGCPKKRRVHQSLGVFFRRWFGWHMWSRALDVLFTRSAARQADWAHPQALYCDAAWPRIWDHGRSLGRRLDFRCAIYAGLYARRIHSRRHGCAFAPIGLFLACTHQCRIRYLAYSCNFVGRSWWALAHRRIGFKPFHRASIKKCFTNHRFAFGIWPAYRFWIAIGLQHVPKVRTRMSMQRHSIWAQGHVQWLWNMETRCWKMWQVPINQHEGIGLWAVYENLSLQQRRLGWIVSAFGTFNSSSKCSSSTHWFWRSNWRRHAQSR